MSTTVTFFEELRIGKNSPKGADVIRKLKEYILQYNRMEGIEDLNITYLELACGDERAVIEDLEESEPGNTWVSNQNGIEWQGMDHVIWNADHPLMVLPEKLDPDREIVFRMSASMTRILKPEYTYGYWLSALDGITPEDGIDYRVAEASDTDETAVLYHLDGNNREEVPRDGSPDLISDIPLWYCETFNLKVTVDNEERFEEFGEKIGGAMQDLLDSIGNEDQEPDIFEGEAELWGSLEVQGEQLPDFLRSLQAVADTAKELGAYIECLGEFLPEERTNHGIEPFASLRVTARDGKIETSACRF